MRKYKRPKHRFVNISQSPTLNHAPKYAIMTLYCLRLGKQKKRCLVEVHDIADLAGRIGRGLMEQVFTTCQVVIAYASMKKDWHKAESAAKEITQQTAAAAVGVSDSRISDYLNKKDYEDNAWVLAARFWQGLCADLQQLTIVADIIQTKLHHKLATIDKMDALSLYTQVLPHFIVGCGEIRCIQKSVSGTGARTRERVGEICGEKGKVA